MSAFDQILAKINGKERKSTDPRFTRVARGKCPVCNKKDDRLSLAEKSDGAILVNCFACGGGGAEIVATLGLDPADLMPPPTPGQHFSRGVRVRGWDWWSLVPALNHTADELTAQFMRLADVVPPNEEARKILADAIGIIKELADQIEAGRGKTGGV